LHEPAYLPDNDLEKVEIGDQEIRRKLVAGNLGMRTNAIDGHDPERERACEHAKCQNDILQTKRKRKQCS
jgi:hypothetical protein